MADIDLIDVSIRDGNQSLWGATGLNTAQILAIAPVMERVGYRAIDFTSSTHMGIAVRTYQEDPWLMIRLMRKAVPNTPLQFIGTGFRFISWETAAQDFMRLVYQRLIANGISRFIVLDPMHDVDALLATAKMIKQEGGSEVMAALTYTLSDVHDDAFYASVAARAAGSPDVDLGYLKDPSGLLTPERAKTLIPAIQKEMNGKDLELHSHCTIGLAPLSYMAAAELGIDGVHTGAGALGDGTSLPSAIRTVANLREAGHNVDIDDKALAEVCDYFSRMAEAEGLPRGAPREYDAAFLRHQIPGGVMTTLKRQLSEIDMEDRLAELIRESERVRAELTGKLGRDPTSQELAPALGKVLAQSALGLAQDVDLAPYRLGRFAEGRLLTGVYGVGSIS